VLLIVDAKSQKVKAWAERQKDDQFSTADDKRRKKLTSLMREFNKQLPRGLPVSRQGG
tara:strand:+ start:512 stop:685 length:174 start_codon:yes stop_codon:yes gene_type:complete